MGNTEHIIYFLIKGSSSLAYLTELNIPQTLIMKYFKRGHRTLEVVSTSSSVHGSNYWLKILLLC